VQRVMAALAAALIAGVVSAQSPPGYATADNPFQGDYAFALGSAIAIKADVKGLLLDSVTVSTSEQVRAGAKVKCQVRVQGRNRLGNKATLKTILLLENAAGRGIEKLELNPFKAKSARAFDEQQSVEVAGDSLRASVSVYIFIQGAF
jgi:hypothetical protein